MSYFDFLIYLSISLCVGILIGSNLKFLMTLIAHSKFRYLFKKKQLTNITIKNKYNE
jgi:hypothetical protein